MRLEAKRSGGIFAALAIGAALILGGVQGGNAQNKPSDADKTGVRRELVPVSDTADAAWVLSGAAQSETVPCELPGRKQARRITLMTRPANYWDVQLTQETAAAVPAGTTLRFRFWGRSKTRNPVYATYEHHAAPYEKYLAQERGD